MKKLVITTLALLSFSLATNAAVTLRYYNKDSKTYTFKVKIDGVYKEVTFDSSRTANVTIQGGARECIIYTSCGEVKVKDGENIEIKDACIK